MAARPRPGAGLPPDPAPPAVERALELISPEAAARADAAAGYLDLVGASRPRSTGLTQDLMLSRAVPLIYARWWRPALGRLAKGLLGPGMAEERRIATRMLGLGAGSRVLDLACGTGAFTRHFGRVVGRDGLTLGIDVSETMLDRAVRETADAALPQVAYIRGDAQELPFRDDSFDGVCCFAALHLFAEPWRSLDRIAAVLVPGGRVAIFTSVRGRSMALRSWQSLIERQSGMRMFGREEVTGALAERGFTDLRLRTTGLTQFVGGTLA